MTKQVQEDYSNPVYIFEYSIDTDQGPVKGTISGTGDYSSMEEMVNSIKLSFANQGYRIKRGPDLRVIGAAPTGSTGGGLYILRL
jgi:hypothetical protein